MQKKVVFFGSSAYSIPSLETLLINNIPVSRVITTEDKPAGRHLKLTPNPLKQFALEWKLPIFTSPSFPLLSLGEGNPKGEVVALVAAYGKIIPESVLNTFNNQIYNIHPSLLPKYRGPSPLQFQILDGLTETGVTLIQIDAKMDHGPIVAQEKDVILDTDTPETLGKRLFIKGTKLFIELLKNNSPLLFPSLNLREGLGVSYPQHQDDSQASFTKKLTRQDGYIAWDEYQSALKTKNPKLKIKLRAFYPWPGLWTTDPKGNRIKITSLFT